MNTKFAIITSNKDIASKNIAKQLELIGITPIVIDEDSIYAENIDKKLDADFLIFATKHKSQQHNKTLSVHAPGNWNRADFGGKPGKVCPTSTFFLKHIFQILNKNAENSGYQVSLECTHHGPYIETPCCFIEIGSTEEEWKDVEAARIIAKTIKEAIETPAEKFKSCIGIGGPHYCPSFNKIQLNSEYAIGHIVPEYHLPLTAEMLNEAIKKTTPEPKLAITDWKGLGNSEQKKEIINLLEKFKLEIIRTSNIKNKKEIEKI